jgi:hypothetical protein
MGRESGGYPVSDFERLADRVIRGMIYTMLPCLGVAAACLRLAPNDRDAERVGLIALHLSYTVAPVVGAVIGVYWARRSKPCRDDAAPFVGQDRPDPQMDDVTHKSG